MQLSSGRCEGGLRGRASRAVLPSLKSYYYIMQQPAPTANPAHATISWAGHGDAGMCHITSPTCRPRKPSPRNNLYYCGHPFSPHCELHRSYGLGPISLNAPKSALVWCGWATPSVRPSNNRRLKGPDLASGRALRSHPIALVRLRSATIRSRLHTSTSYTVPGPTSELGSLFLLVMLRVDLWPCESPRQRIARAEPRLSKTVTMITRSTSSTMLPRP